MNNKTLFLAVSYSNSSVYQYFEGLVTALSSSFEQICVFLDKNKTGPQPPRSNIQFFTWPSRTPNKLKDFIFLAKKIYRHKPHCLIGNFTAANLFNIGGALGGVPVRIIWYHTVSEAIPLDSGGLSLKHRFQRVRKKFIYSLATHIVCNSKHSQNDIKNVYGIAPPKSSTLPLLLKDPELQITTPDRSGKTVICIARLVPNKDQGLLIKEIPKILKSAPGTRFVFVGGGSEQKMLEDLTESLDIQGACEFTGEVNKEAVLEYYSRAWLSVSTSRYEAFGLVNLESLSMGVPVVAVKTGGIPDIIRDGEDGFLVSKNNPAELADKIISILKSDSLRNNMSIKGRQRFDSVFSLKNNAASQADILLELMALKP